MDVDEAEDIERSHSPEKVRPEVKAMSSLAMGADTSIRVRDQKRGSLGIPHAILLWLNALR